MTQKTNDNSSSKLAYLLIFLLSAGVLLFLFWLIYYKGSSESVYLQDTIGSLPLVNAILNFTTSLFLISGFKWGRVVNFGDSFF